LLSVLLALFWLATGGQGSVFAQTLPDAGQVSSPDAAPPSAALPDDASAKQATPSSQEPAAKAPSPVSETSEEMPIDVMVPPSGDLLIAKEPNSKSSQDLSLEALFNIDISVASKSLMKQSEAPSIVTVITRSHD